MKPCIATQTDSSDMEFPSILDAAMYVEKSLREAGKVVPRGGCAGNICRALKTKKTAYGWAWREKAV